MNVYPIKQARLNKVEDYELFLIETINKAIEEKSVENLPEYGIFIPLSVFNEGKGATTSKVLKEYEDEGYIIDKGITSSGLGVEISW